MAGGLGEVALGHRYGAILSLWSRRALQELRSEPLVGGWTRSPSKRRRPVDDPGKRDFVAVSEGSREGQSDEGGALFALRTPATADPRARTIMKLLEALRRYSSPESAPRAGSVAAVAAVLVAAAAAQGGSSGTPPIAEANGRDLGVVEVPAATTDDAGLRAPQPKGQGLVPLAVVRPPGSGID